MVRTSAGIRISAGKSSKKGGGASSSAPSTPSNGRTGSKGSSRLPRIPHCDAPSWQKPITNFFNAGASSSKDDPQIIDEDEKNNLDSRTETEDKHNKGESSILVNKIDDNFDAVKETNNPDGDEKDKADIEKSDLNNMNDDEPHIKRRKKEQDKENEDNNT